MSPTFFRPPRDMADARRTLTTPAIHNGHPAIIQDAWLFLAEARGLRVDLNRLTPAHLIDRASPAIQPEAPAINHVDAARVSAIPLIRRAIRSLGLDPQGAA
jgi:hypothetical protein